MSVFQFLRGPYLILLLVAVVLHVLLGYFSPDPNGYVYDFYSDPVIILYETGQLPDIESCVVCYHPPLLPILGAAIFHVVAWLGGDSDAQLYTVTWTLSIFSFFFIIYTFNIYLHYRKNKRLDLVLWGLILFLPVIFISTFSLEADLLTATLIVAATYYFIQFLSKEQLNDLILTAVLIALAALTKYSGLIIAVYFGGVLLVRYFRGFGKQHFKQGLIYLMIVFLLGGFPYVKNIIDHGTPIAGNRAWDTNSSYYRYYDFKLFSLNDIVDVSNDDREIYLRKFAAFNSDVLSSHYAQLWTDLSFFTKAKRHGQWERAVNYQGKYLPNWLLWSILITGLVPVIAGVGGFVLLAISREAPLLLGMFVLTVALYIDWFIGSNSWMLKTKYLLYLLPLWLVSINKFAAFMPKKIFIGSIIPSVVFSVIYSFYFAVF